MCYTPKLVALDRTQSQSSGLSYLLNQEEHLSYARCFLSCLNHCTGASGHPEFWVWFCITRCIFTFNTSCIYTTKKPQTTHFSERNIAQWKAKNSQCTLVSWVTLNIFKILIFSVSEVTNLPLSSMKHNFWTTDTCFISVKKKVYLEVSWRQHFEIYWDITVLTKYVLQPYTQHFI